MTLNGIAITLCLCISGAGLALIAIGALDSGLVALCGGAILASLHLVR